MRKRIDSRTPTRSHCLTCSASLLVLLVLSALATVAQAQIPARPQQQSIALIGGTVHTISGESIENGIVLFSEGVIRGIGIEVEIPEDCQRIDVSGKHVYPGLIDAETNLGLFENSSIQQATDTNEEGEFNPNVRAEVAFHPASRHIGVARSAGVLVVLSSPSGGLVSGYASAMNLDGWTWEQMSLKGKTALVLNWPSPGDESRYNNAIKRLNEIFADARSYLSTRESENPATSQQPAHGRNQDPRFQAMQPVFERQLPVIVAANDLRQIQDAIRFAKDQNIRIIIRGGRDSGLIAKQLAEEEIGVILTSLLTSSGNGWQGYDELYVLPLKLHQAGVKFAISGESSAQYVNRTPFEAGAAVAFGLPEDIALKALTLHPAELLGLSDRVGSLQVGKDATLIITSGSPIEYSTLIEKAYIQGRELDMQDMHKEFYQKYLKRLDQ